MVEQDRGKNGSDRETEQAKRDRYTSADTERNELERERDREIERDSPTL
jgi:hypothetical protein